MGALLATALLVCLTIAIVAVVRRPARGLGVLVAGMAVHNILLMLLLRFDAPEILVRVLQAWKEMILLVLVVIVVFRLVGTRRQQALRGLQSVDLLAMAFVVVVLFTFVRTTGGVDFTHRVLGLRTLLYLPLLYFLGRILWTDDRRDLSWNVGLILGAATIVGSFGLWELWFTPTSAWLDWGVNVLSEWSGYTYNGPANLPENFFHLTDQGVLLRRMVSTYISPLGVAYTGLLVVPLAAAALTFSKFRTSLPRKFVVLSMVMLLVSIALSVTRLAVMILGVEVFLLIVILRGHWALWGVPLTAALIAFTFFAYEGVGPVVGFGLEPIREPAGYVVVQGLIHSGVLSLIDTAVAAERGATKVESVAKKPQQALGDPRGHWLLPEWQTFASIFLPEGQSFLEHQVALGADFDYARSHPLGGGIGVSILRYNGGTQGVGESAVFDVFAETGFPGGLIYLVLFLMCVVAGARRIRATREDPTRGGFALVCCVGGLALAPVMVTSDVWGDLSVTFLFWWAAGWTVALSAKPDDHRQEDGPAETISPPAQESRRIAGRQTNGVS